MRVVVGLAAVVAAATLIGSWAHPSDGAPLWPGSRFRQADRDRALRRGLHFIYETIARNPRYFRIYGYDLMEAFYNISATSLDPELRREARGMGHERAVEWRRLYPTVSEPLDADRVRALVLGNDVAERLGVADPPFRTLLRKAAARFTVYDYLLFDPVEEPPPADIPDTCAKCGMQNARGATACARCGARLKMRNRYDLYQDALIASYRGDRTGITLGAHYVDVLQWLPAMRPYPTRPPADDDSYYAGIYAATHSIYTYDDYSMFRITRRCFLPEFEHLKANLRQAIAEQDAETVGEYLDSLGALGLTRADAPIESGFEYLLSSQNSDGSWGDSQEKDPYARYHPTWTAIDGLREYRWKRVRPCPSW